MGDFDGNGLADVYWVQGDDGNAARDVIFLNQGGGQFTQTNGLMTAAFKMPVQSVWEGKRLNTYNYSHLSNRLIVGDFNGDSLSDLYFWGNGDGYSYDRPNGSGYETVAVPGQDSTGYVYLSKGDGTFQRAAHIPLVIFRDYMVGTLQTGDFNGDQITDLMLVQGDNQTLPIKIFLMDKDGQVAEQINGPDHYIAANKSDDGIGVSLARIQVNDFNRDGISDIYQYAFDGNDVLHFFDSAGDHESVAVTGFARTETSTNNAVDYQRVHFVDLNSDGFLDVYEVLNPAKGLDKIYLGTGTGQFAYHGTGINSFVGNYPSSDVARVKFADMNGDGLVDLYHVTGWQADVAENHIYYNQINQPGTFGPAEGTGVFTYVNEVYSNNSVQALSLVDFNGDGAADIYRFPQTFSVAASKPYEGTIHYWNNESQLVESIVDGLGKITEFIYSTMIDLDLYTPGVVFNTYPNVALRAPIPLVASIAHDNGVGGLNRTSYRYQNMRVNKRGAGMLGFEEQWITDETTGMEQYTQFSQRLDDRSVGQPLITTTRLGGIEINRTVNEYVFQTHQGVEFTYPKTSTEIKRDLSGDHIQTTSSSTEYSTGGTSDIVPMLSESCVSHIDPGLITSPIDCTNLNHQFLKKDQMAYYPEASFRSHGADDSFKNKYG